MQFCSSKYLRRLLSSSWTSRCITCTVFIHLYPHLCLLSKACSAALGSTVYPGIDGKVQFNVPFPFDALKNNIKKDISFPKGNLLAQKDNEAWCSSKARAICKDAACIMQHIVYIPLLLFCLHQGKVRHRLWTPGICQRPSWDAFITVKHRWEKDSVCYVKIMSTC